MDAFSSSFLSTFPTQKISISHAITSPKLSSIYAVRIEERPTSQPPASRPPPPPPKSTPQPLLEVKTDRALQNNASTFTVAKHIAV
ncbi:hypothetical protein ACFX12_009136 [Malus domestica]